MVVFGDACCGMRTMCWSLEKGIGTLCASAFCLAPSGLAFSCFSCSLHLRFTFQHVLRDYSRCSWSVGLWKEGVVGHMDVDCISAICLSFQPLSFIYVLPTPMLYYSDETIA
jgi:hypothetical protein